MNVNNNKIKIVYIILGVLVTILTFSYAVFTYVGTSTNQQLVLGEIYMYYNEINQLTIENTLPGDDYSNYFEFTINGKNTYNQKDIYYEIVLTKGDTPEDKVETNRLSDSSLLFKLVEVVNDTETVLLEDKTYVDLTSQRIYVATINKGTTTEVNKRYRLYAKINDNITICGGEITEGCDYYTNGNVLNWADAFASIKVNVTGDFTEKEIGATDELKANLLDGQTFNTLLKELNKDMTEFKRSPIEPNLEEIDYIMISTNESNFPVYAWNDNNIIYWWSEADKLLLNSNSNKMFYGMESLTRVEFSTLDSSEVTTMDFMFQYCKSLTTMDLRLDTSKVVSMDAMFANCTNLQSIDFSHIDTSKVQNFHGLVAGCTELRSINLNGMNVESATNFESMFSTLPNLTEIDLSGFNTPNLETIYFMFLRCTNLTTVYASENLTIDKINVATGAFYLADKIVGGAGTVYDASNSKNVSYFRIDDPDNGKPGYLTLKNARYIRYDGNGADGGEAMTSHYLTTTNYGNLKMNTYTNTGLTFSGWNTKPDGSGEYYTNGQLMNSLVASKVPLTLYAQWR